MKTSANKYFKDIWNLKMANQMYIFYHELRMPETFFLQYTTEHEQPNLYVEKTIFCQNTIFLLFLVTPLSSSKLQLVASW